MAFIAIAILCLHIMSATWANTSSNPPLVFRNSRTSDCGGSDSLIEFDTSSLSPDPILNPGAALISADMNVKEDMSLEGARVKLRLQKLEPRQMRVPCFRRFGSCSYDICQMITDNPDIFCPMFPTGTECDCALTAGTYTAVNAPLMLPYFGKIIRNIMQGNYKGNATIIDRRGNTIACLAFDFAIKNTP